MYRVLVAASLIGLVGCVHATSPLKVEQRIAQRPQRGLVMLSSRPTEQVGEVKPIDLNVANGLPGRIRVDASQVFAINELGQRVAPIPTGEAVKLCGDATELSSAMKSGLASGAMAAVLGGAAGAAYGALGGGGAASGAAIGAGIAAAAGGGMGAGAGTEASRQESERQIGELALHDRYIEPGRSVNGYAFFPPGTYSAVEMLIVDEEGEQTTLRSTLIGQES